jgi:hypothetical protein
MMLPSVSTSVTVDMSLSLTTRCWTSTNKTTDSIYWRQYLHNIYIEDSFSTKQMLICAKYNILKYAFRSAQIYEIISKLEVEMLKISLKCNYKIKINCWSLVGIFFKLHAIFWHMYCTLVHFMCIFYIQNMKTIS